MSPIMRLSAQLMAHHVWDVIEYTSQIKQYTFAWQRCIMGVKGICLVAARRASCGCPAPLQTRAAAPHRFPEPASPGPTTCLQPLGSAAFLCCALSATRATRPHGRSTWSGWPARGTRIGEAAHPGPPDRERLPARGAPPSVGSGARVFCPVPGCLCADPARAPGWASATSMKSHIDAHLSGSLHGEVPSSWLANHNRTRSLVCGLSVSANRGVHPTCRPEARAAASNPAMEVDAPLALILRHIPASARHSWNQVLTRALAQVAHTNDERAWRELLMLPQCLLCCPPRRGRQHRKAVAAYTLDRLQRWQSGKRMSLWDSRPPPRKLHGPAPAPDQRQALAISLGREGFDRKACAALQSGGLCPPTPAMAQALEALHPQVPAAGAPRPMHELPLAGEVSPDLVARCLRGFPAETAPGPSGLRVQHLKDACLPGNSDGFLSQLTSVVGLLAQGRAPSSVAPVLAGAGLVALPKPGGGARPIAIGEILRRLTGKCLLQLVRDDARAFFWPAQVGVAVPGGAEVAIHTVRSWAERHAGSRAKVLVKLDFRNAFNSINRDAVLNQTLAHFPPLARWATWCYRQPTRLQFGDHVLQSATGVQQVIHLDLSSSQPPSAPSPVSLQRLGWMSPCTTWMMGCWPGTL